MMRIALALIAALALTACGQRADLKPLAGEQLPPPPLGASEPKSPEELLTPPTQPAPERSVELRRRSEEREDDPFALPPE